MSKCPTRKGDLLVVLTPNDPDDLKIPGMAELWKKAGEAATRDANEGAKVSSAQPIFDEMAELRKKYQN